MFIITANNLFITITILLLYSIHRIICHRPSAVHRSDVYIAGFFPYGDGVENAQTGRGVMPSVKLALDHVNEHTNILRKYRLHMWWNDTECNAAVGVKSFFDMMHSGPHKLMLFGAACTHVTDPIAKASKHWHLTQLSYADTHPMFTKDAFPNFFRVVPSENAFNAPRLALLKEFNWTRIGTIYQNEPRYSLPHNHMVADLDALGFDVVETQSFVNDVSESLHKLKDKDVRVILGNFNEYWARKVFCEAYRLEMFGRQYQWLIMGTYSSEWWNITSDCLQNELMKALDATIMTDLLPLSTTGDITISGITADEYLSEYDSRRGNEYSRFHGYTYDGIWAAALAIQYVAERKEQFLSKFEYRVKDWENIFLEALKNTSFEGVTGPVRFYNNERRANILLKQFQSDCEIKIGEYNSIQGRLDFSPGEPLRWIGRHPPKDRTLRIIEHSQVNLTIYAILASCSVLGIIMAIVFLGFNIKYRNQRYIKMSSPHLNNLIIIGCMLTYLSVIFLGLDSGLSSIAAFPYICTARAWLLMAGFSLAFGAMFSKTWRVHSIFTDVKLNKKVIKDYQLFMVVGILLGIDLVIMTTWQIADPFYRDTKQIEPTHHPSLDDVLIVQENEYCQSERITIFIGVIYAYKGLLLIFGAFLAWETRHVSIPALNDSKHIGLSVYNVLIMCIMGAAIALVLSDRKDAVFILISVFIIFCTTATLCLVFVPKLLEMKRNPQGAVDKRIRATLRPMSKNRRDSSVCELEQRLRDVKSNNCRFRKALMDKEAELQALIRTLGPEARNWIDGSNCGDSEPLLNNKSRLSVPTVRRDLPSTTEVTEMTSVGSITSAAYQDTEPLTTMTDIKTNNIPFPNSTAIQPQQPPQQQPPPSQQPTQVVQPPPPSSQPQHQKIHENQSNNIAKSELLNRSRKSLDKLPIESNNNNSSQIENHKQKLLSTSTAADDAGNDVHFIKNKCSPSPSNKYKDMEENTSNRTKINTQLNSASLTHSNSELNSLCPHGKGSIKNPEQRRVSVQIGSTIKGNFVVSQSELWDTNTLSHAKQHIRQQQASPRNHPVVQRCQQHSHSISATSAYDYQQQQQQQQQQQLLAQQQQLQQQNPQQQNHQTTPIQRSVSEKNRPKHRHKSSLTKLSLGQCETDSERERENLIPTPCQQKKKLIKTMQHGHHHSSPNVAPPGTVMTAGHGHHGHGHLHGHSGATSNDLKHRKARTKTEPSSNALLFTASSESELLDGGVGNGGTGGGGCGTGGDTAILPIFRKLLTEKQPRYRGRNNVVGASCPNISIKCDIVEYL